MTNLVVSHDVIAQTVECNPINTLQRLEGREKVCSLSFTAHPLLTSNKENPASSPVLLSDGPVRTYCQHCTAGSFSLLCASDRAARSLMQCCTEEKQEVSLKSFSSLLSQLRHTMRLN